MFFEQLAKIGTVIRKLFSERLNGDGQHEILIDKISNATQNAFNLLSKDFRSRIAFRDCKAFSADDPRALAEFK